MTLRHCLRLTQALPSIPAAAIAREIADIRFSENIFEICCPRRLSMACETDPQQLPLYCRLQSDADRMRCRRGDAADHFGTAAQYVDTGYQSQEYDKSSGRTGRTEIIVCGGIARKRRKKRWGPLVQAEQLRPVRRSFLYAFGRRTLASLRGI